MFSVFEMLIANKQYINSHAQAGSRALTSAVCMKALIHNI